jgi:hypothetical protein
MKKVPNSAPKCLFAQKNSILLCKFRHEKARANNYLSKILYVNRILGMAQIRFTLFRLRHSQKG